VSAVEPAPGPWLVAAVALLAAAVVLVPRAWAMARHVGTIVHEAGHALVAVLTGRRLAGIRLHSDSSGVTVSVGRSRGPGMVTMLAAGYPAPALLGLGAAAVLETGHVAALLWALVLLLFGMLLLVRNWFGAWTVLASGAAVFAVTWWLPGRAQSAFGYLVTWFLLFAGVREVLGLVGARRGGGARGSDADQLARLTHVPAAVWVGLFFLIAVAAAVAGVALLR
jgi:Peptidase M50B-like